MSDAKGHAKTEREMHDDLIQALRAANRIHTMKLNALGEYDVQCFPYGADATLDALADERDRLREALRAVLELHIARHNAPEHAAARAALREGDET